MATPVSRHYGTYAHVQRGPHAAVNASLPLTPMRKSNDGRGHHHQQELPRRNLYKVGVGDMMLQ